MASCSSARKCPTSPTCADDTMTYAYPGRVPGCVGDDLASFSYVHAGQVDRRLRGESSVELSSGENVFLFVRPVNVGGSYYGKAVGASRSLTLEQLDAPKEAGYRTSYGRSALRMAART
ncbi:MAG: hypothetical protein ACLTMP_11220 [Eggerthella lenta]